MDNWPEPNSGEKRDLDLGDGHSLTWSYYEGELCGGIIRHTTPVSETAPHGYCEGAFWIANNSFTKKHKPGSPQWQLRGTLERPTLEPSFLCHCGDHGFIREGRWVRA